MGETPDQLTRDIEETRGRLGDHLDELQEKVSPSAIASRRTQAARSRLLGVRERALGSVRSTGDHLLSPGDAAGSARDTAVERFEGAPLAAGLAAFGLGMVISALVPASRAEQRAAVKVKDDVQERAQPLVEHAKEAASSSAEDLKQVAADSAQQVKDVGTDAASRLGDEGRSAAESVRDSSSS